MIFDLHGKTIERAFSRREGSVSTLEILFTDGSTFVFQVRPLPNESGRLFDAVGGLLSEQD